jgi:hypothetical protein
MTDDLIKTIKKSIPLAPFVAQYTGGLKSSGRGFFVGRCPFHKSKNPKKLKFWVNSNFSVCGCFVPGCPAYANHRADPTSKPLDIINFYALLHDLTLQQSVRALAERLPLSNGSNWHAPNGNAN